MAHAKLPLFVFLILFVLSSSSGKLIVKELTHVDAQPPVAEIPSFLPTEVKNIHGKMADRLHFPHKIKVPSMKARKLLEEELVQPDYDYAGPNPKHDPKKGRGGGRSL